ncbi:MAG: phosphatidylglycerol:prolipoprotein diacylglycerol transferase [Hyphomicrobiaceae bacterium]|jgi:phosphatidylglycerol:prolipoprotein diacylglycerol transferase
MHPHLFTLGSVSVSSYEFFLFLALVAVHFAVYWAADRLGIEDRTVKLTALGALVGGVVGAKAMTGLVYWVSLDQSAEALQRGLGAMSDTGLFVFAEILIGLAAWMLSKDPLRVLDVWAFAAVIGSPIGRLGCLMAGCCYGQATTMPWGLTYPHTHHGAIAARGLPLHPTPLYMAAGVFCVWLLLRAMIQRRTPPGSILITAWLGYATVRFSVEFFRADLSRGAWFGDTLTTYQLIVATAAVLHLLLAARLWSRPQPSTV